MNEIAHISRFPDYEFHASGEVVSNIRKTPRILKPIRMGNYFGVQLRGCDGVTKKEYVHRLIAEAFHGPPPDGLVCCHADGDKNNNSAANLRWDTQRNNNLDKRGHGTSADGERNPMAKLTWPMVNNIRLAHEYTGRPYSLFAEEYGVSVMTICRLINRQTWSHR